MKKSILIMLFSFSVILMAIATSNLPVKQTNNFAGGSWRFKSALSSDPTTLHYLTTIYEGSEYRFSEDRTFTGSFFGLVVTGTWEISNNKLILNKGTDKEETYTFQVSPSNDLVLEGTEKGNKVFINFVKG